MKPKKEWITKALKRQRKRKDHGIVDFMMILSHFFRDFTEWISEMQDPRHQSYITYTQTDLTYMGILKNICGIKSMRSMDEQFNEENCIDTLRILSGDEHLKEMPHADTLNYYLEMLNPKELSELRNKMIRRLIRMKSFDRKKLLGKYWRVILDGTGLFCFKEKHCENCLKTTVTDKDGKETTMYYHKVLEAKLVLGDKIVISLGTEFIENENETISKQDCETRAAKRLLKRIKETYPRLSICIQGDALYETAPMMEICRENGWKYLLVHKDGSQKVLEETCEYIRKADGETLVKGIGKEKGCGGYINHVEETAGKREISNIFRYTYDRKEKEDFKTITFNWNTNIELNEKNLEEMIEAGRGRWKIENEGFNNQKNGIYDIEHLNSYDTNAMKNHYLLTQIADIIMQLYLAWNPLRKEIKQSIKNTSSRLLESFRGLTVTDEDVLTTSRYTTIYLE